MSRKQEISTRRQFIRQTGCALCALAWPARADSPLVEARYYEKLPNRKIRCLLCPRRCVIDDLERGYCGARENRGGVYYSLVYGQVVSAHIDPIEKKPLFHFLPSARAFSIATAGCNVFCKFCQNWEISQSRPEQIPATYLPPPQLVRLAGEKSCPVIAYTYNEPVIFAEYMYDVAGQGRSLGVRSVMISNGYIEPQPMRDLCRVLHAVKIDLKAFTERFYKELVSGQLRPVLDTLVLLRKENIWTEIVYLVIPGQNDDRKELTEMCRWIAAELGPEVPVHFTRFHPMYRLTNVPATPPTTLTMARKIGLDAGLHYVYTGNIPGDEGENTYCPNCHKMVIHRFGYAILENRIQNSRCPDCRALLAGVWE
ncbi:AmmeMemoRadiSam system radical SAM enzyme [bacterium]|nr:AmmeMemoRadiSam system radical SAM enzyme [bacterium]